MDISMDISMDIHIHGKPEVDRQTYMFITILRTPPGGEVTCRTTYLSTTGRLMHQWVRSEGSHQGRRLWVIGAFILAHCPVSFPFSVDFLCLVSYASPSLRPFPSSSTSQNLFFSHSHPPSPATLFLFPSLRNYSFLNPQLFLSLT